MSNRVRITLPKSLLEYIEASVGRADHDCGQLFQLIPSGLDPTSTVQPQSRITT
jgi:hypothetical protein